MDNLGGKMSDDKNWYDDGEPDKGKSENNWNNHSFYGYEYVPPTDPPGTNRRFANAAFACGIISLVSLWSGVFSIVFGGLGVMFANLSRRKGKAYPGRGRAGHTLAMIGLIIGLVITIYTAYILIESYLTNGTYFQQFESTYRSFYGKDFDLKDFGIDLSQFGF